MRIRWDQDKRQKIIAQRKVDFADLEDSLYQPYVEDQSLSYAEQYRALLVLRADDWPPSSSNIVKTLWASLSG
jgi:uncharacterized DUF497 family protein